MPTADIGSAKTFLDAALGLVPCEGRAALHPEPDPSQGAVVYLTMPARAPAPVRIVIHDPRAEAA